MNKIINGEANRSQSSAKPRRSEIQEDVLKDQVNEKASNQEIRLSLWFPVNLIQTPWKSQAPLKMLKRDKPATSSTNSKKAELAGPREQPRTGTGLPWGRGSRNKRAKVTVFMVGSLQSLVGNVLGTKQGTTRGQLCQGQANLRPRSFPHFLVSLW